MYSCEVDERRKSVSMNLSESDKTLNLGLYEYQPRIAVPHVYNKSCDTTHEVLMCMSRVSSLQSGKAHDDETGGIP